MMEVFFNFGRVHFATISGNSVPKDQLSVALVHYFRGFPMTCKV